MPSSGATATLSIAMSPASTSKVSTISTQTPRPSSTNSPGLYCLDLEPEEDTFFLRISWRPPPAVLVSNVSNFSSTQRINAPSGTTNQSRLPTPGPSCFDDLRLLYDWRTVRKETRVWIPSVYKYRINKLKLCQVKATRRFLKTDKTIFTQLFEFLVKSGLGCCSSTLP